MLSAIGVQKVICSTLVGRTQKSYNMQYTICNNYDNDKDDDNKPVVCFLLMCEALIVTVIKLNASLLL